MAKISVKKKSEINLSNDYHCIHSKQKFNSEFDINVFTSNIPISQLLKNRDIMLVDDLKGDSRWGMNKIIQRNISTKRVEEIKDEYLETQNRAIKFFPAITVVLLPKTNGEPNPQYMQSQDFFDGILGVSIGKSYETDKEEYIYDYPVVLNWDRNQISALVIDGQHRVSAIRSFYESKNETTYTDISIPVAFVVFKNTPKLDLIQATRALFIDVNNTPRLVSEEKLIFIDDRNLHRRITAKVFGANNPGDNHKDCYQNILEEEDYSLRDDSFINRYLIEESGKDDEERTVFLNNHKTLFPWEITNIMTIHKNILGNIILKYKDVDKTRDIRSICFLLHSGIVEEIDTSLSLEQFDNTRLKKIFERLKNTDLNDAEIEVFKNFIRIRTNNLLEIQQVQSDFFVGTLATKEEEEDRSEIVNLLQNVYNQECSKDTTFEFSANNISDIIKGKSFVYVEILTYFFNNLWFTKEIKESILQYKDEKRRLIFNFIYATHESLKSENSNIRRKPNRIESLINVFLKDVLEDQAEKKEFLNKWIDDITNCQKTNLLRTVVGQEMLFIFIVQQELRLNMLAKEDLLVYINLLGEKQFFNSDHTFSLEFFNEPTFKIVEFNHWSEIIMKGSAMKPGMHNASKGANLINFIKNSISNRESNGVKLNFLNALQKSYGQDVFDRISKNDPQKIFKMYSSAREYSDLKKYLSQKDIDTIMEEFQNAEGIEDRVKNVLIKLFGGIALEQVVEYFKESC